MKLKLLINHLLTIYMTSPHSYSFLVGFFQNLGQRLIGCERNLEGNIRFVGIVIISVDGCILQKLGRRDLLTWSKRCIRKRKDILKFDWRPLDSSRSCNTLRILN